MKLSVPIGVLLSVVSLSNLVVGDPTSVLIFTSTKTTNNPNDYFDDVTHEILKGKKSSIVNIKLPTKKELPPTMQMKMHVVLPDQDPFEYSKTICDAMTDPVIGSTFVKSGLPKDTFPKVCPFGPGDWSIEKWDPPVHEIPPGVSDGIVTGYVLLGEENKPPCFQIDFVGELSHAAPSAADAPGPADAPSFGR